MILPLSIPVLLWLWILQEIHQVALFFTDARPRGTARIFPQQSGVQDFRWGLGGGIVVGLP